MHRITVISGSTGRLAELKADLSAYFDADYLSVADLPHNKPQQVTILDIDLRESVQVQAIKVWLTARPTNAQLVVGIDDKASYLEFTQACAIGATLVMARPFDGARLYRALSGARCANAPALRDAVSDPASEFNTLQQMFATAGAGRSPNLQAVKLAGAQIVDKINEMGLSDYLEAIRKHHSQTYQHCLTVTAVAVSFGAHLGFNRNDMEKLALAGLLHDVGKAKIPIDILEKPAALDEAEVSTMQLHPALGHEILRRAIGLPYDILDMVLHHHEYLDGSGYPHGLKGREVTDLTRMMTIADVYGALIEWRPYRPPMSGRKAFQILDAMGEKLDVPLVREFAPLACSVRD